MPFWGIFIVRPISCILRDEHVDVTQMSLSLFRTPYSLRPHKDRSEFFKTQMVWGVLVYWLEHPTLNNVYKKPGLELSVCIMY